MQMSGKFAADAFGAYFASTRPKLEISAPDTTIRERFLSELNKQSWSHVHKLRDGDEWRRRSMELHAIRKGTPGDQGRRRVHSGPNRGKR